jgi:uncharacterized linocin/CFP29 family protein
MAAMNAGRPFTPGELRTNDTLRRDDWIAFDRAIVEGAVPRLRLVADLISAGLTVPLANAMGRTVLSYQTMGDMDPAIVSMDGMARSENNSIDFELASLPIPITHKDFFINLRKLAASRNGGEPLDTTMARIAGRKVGEEVERMSVSGGKTFAGLPIYGLITAPSRFTVGFGTNGAWSAGAKTGDNILADVFTLIAALEARGFNGPYWLYIPTNSATKVEGDFKANGDRTVRERLAALPQIADIRYLYGLPNDNIVLVQPTADVISIINGETVQTVQWDINGGFGVNFKAFAIQVPLIRANPANQTGIAHMS